MNPTSRYCLLAFALIPFGAWANPEPPTDEAWTRPRDISAFQFLLDRSPFSLPTAEESSPLAERFALTGAVSIDGDPLVFVMDRTTQTRHMLSKKPNEQSMGLVEYLPDPDPRRMRATIRVGSEVATISYTESATQQPGQPQQSAAMAGPQQPGAPAVAGVPGAIPQPGIAPGTGQPGSEPPRRIIRRRVISGQLGP
jgi:hypothetical protein